MVQTMEFSVEGIVHPFVENAQKNNWEMSCGNICLFTGSNMAGKSTTLKALALAVWLAHCGICPFRLSQCFVLFMRGYIHLSTCLILCGTGEVILWRKCFVLRKFYKRQGPERNVWSFWMRCLRGTNAKDAFEASVAVNELLKEYSNCHFLISTHILEYAKAFELDPFCCFYYMEAEIKDDNFVCPHRLQKGISEARVGYWVVRKLLNMVELKK